MAQQKETRFSQRFARELNKIPGVWFVKIQQVTKRGTPDYLICAGGVFLAAELKIEGGRSTPLQEYNLEAIRLCGGTARIVTPSTAQEFLDEIKEYAEHYFEAAKLAKTFDFGS